MSSIIRIQYLKIIIFLGNIQDSIKHWLQKKVASEDLQWEGWQHPEEAKITNEKSKLQTGGQSDLISRCLLVNRILTLKFIHQSLITAELKHIFLRKEAVSL